MQPTAQALARTYSDRVYPDPWEKVLDHRRVLDYAAEHPNAGRVRVGNALDLPNERIRGWLEDMIPDPVRAINTAIDHGWLDPDPDSETAAALVELLAHVLAGGSIAAKSYVPAVTPGERVSAAEIRRAFERVGVETRTRNDDNSGRATEIVPTCNGTILGRCLVTMGAPTGVKTTLDRIPAVVWEVPPGPAVVRADLHPSPWAELQGEIDDPSPSRPPGFLHRATGRARRRARRAGYRVGHRDHDLG